MPIGTHFDDAMASSAATETSSLASFVRLHHEDIVREWEGRVREEIERARHLDRPVLIDHLPPLLRRIGEIIDDVERGDPPRMPDDLAAKHALERHRVGFRLREVVREYTLVRSVVMELRQSQPGAGENLPALIGFDRAMDEAVRASIEKFVELDREELRAHAEALARALQRASRLERMVSAHPDFFYILDREHRFVFASESLLRLWGRTLDEALGKTFAELGYPEHLVELHRRQLDRALEGATVRDENEYVRGDGSVGHYEYIFVPLRGDDGEIDAIGGVTRDVTHHKRVEGELRTEARLREELLAVVSHDLRQPLNTITLSADVAQELAEQGEDVRKTIEVVRRSAKTMDALIAELLDTAKLQTGNFSIECARCDVLGAIAETLDLMEVTASNKKIELRRELPAETPSVDCDRGRIQQVFSNLVGNALKFCGPGGVVTVRGEVEGDALLFAVEDTGPGIPEPELPRVFDRYWSKRSAGGTGLGLFISRGLVEAHGGQIWAENRPSGGALFRVRLPITRS